MIYELSAHGYHAMIWKKIMPTKSSLLGLIDIVKNVSPHVVEEIGSKPSIANMICYDKEFEDEFLHSFTDEIDLDTDEGDKKLYDAAFDFVSSKDIGFAIVNIMKSYRNKNASLAFAQLVGNKKSFLNKIVNNLHARSPGIGDIYDPNDEEKAMDMLFISTEIYMKLYETPEEYMAMDLYNFYRKSIEDANDFLKGGKL